ncbi:conserved hypothetical protein [Talaromyces stipitatus ATCC 10500]|uniref:C3H1-type domain-containing protein n=1 Tax=Talaromyces stipitatus (strain ATCC 10500 / CBS 375.48 / QM 6759 / NRRL 1006) TaxID=441959 RepID=B8LTL2_TALSN|nr:uncharacterized protein TSTA_065460 [Talaromyces stipitatus ATCC 10500]EED23090.1 conserved hypothetical protein [Talaromyces stipitatus ATCC 10500]
MHQNSSTHPHGNGKQKPCRFFGTKKGCRSGDACPYLHIAPDQGVPETVSAPTQSQKVRKTNNSQRQAVPKPVPKAQQDSPRDFQIAQLRRRFHPKERQDDSGNTFTFGMAPTDPDFPFDMPKLYCSLHVPHDWPAETSRPRLRVTNPDMPRGFQINVERGFDGLIDSAIKDRRPITLLGLMNSLDRSLERFLSAEKAPTIKIVANTTGRKASTPAPSKEEPKSQVEEKPATPIERIVPVPKRVEYTPEQRAEAEKTRKSETKQLEARLNRIPLYKKLDDLRYIIPITPTKLERLPVSLHAVKSVKLSVPALYPLEKSSVEFQAIDTDEARAVELGFKQWILKGPHTTLMAQVNYLANNMHLLLNAPTNETKQPEIQAPAADLDTVPAPIDEDHDHDSSADSDRAHIVFIPRPPEWSMPGGQDSDDSDSPFDDSSDYDPDSAEESQDGGAPITGATSSSSTANAPARGTAVNLPSLEMYGIELLEAKMLSITAKCDRCKEHTDIKNIKSTDDPSQPSPIRVESCRKCANSFNIAFRRQLMHPNSQRAGYLDLEGCTAFDLLPSYFQPTCSECSTPFPAPGILAVRGDSAMASCRECHRKMSFKISEVKFMIVGVSALSHLRVVAPRKKNRENLGIVAGQELPRRGRCKHYGKSYRWFRFSCCAKVFPCDKYISTFSHLIFSY